MTNVKYIAHIELWALLQPPVVLSLFPAALAVHATALQGQ